MTPDLDFFVRELARPGPALAGLPTPYGRSVTTPDAGFELERARQCYRGGDLIEARVSGERAAARSPGSADARGLLAALCLQAGDPAAAAGHAEAAARLAPAWPDAARLSGDAAAAMGDGRSAAEHFKRALSLKPHWPAVDVRLGETLLKSGDLAEGFGRYESRFAARELPVPQPAWDGRSPLWGKTVLVVPEREIGDLVLFVRYAESLKRRGARVHVLCPGDLVPLIETVPGVESAVPLGSALPRADYVVPMLSLPHLLGSTLGTLPADVPYLSPDDGLAAAWREHLAKEAAGARLRVGVVWADAGEPSSVPVRSVPLAALSPLWAVPDTAFFAVQQGPPHEELTTTRTPLIDVSEDLTGPGSVVASIAALDLLIGVDTPATHVGGALNKPTWAMLAAACDWRWLGRSEATPWYPAVRCFRQDSPGDWEPVVRRMAVALHEFAAGKA